ncbi:AAA family ATPase [Pigmentibacter sp. JX0631]|uniref:AAA family ATPase n=1 Tax=Pigmentibacter sp. JX0631 TaxID=2976982 RepID=UPI0024682F2C|nr:AAA family ATPase [Pigmentibacter sp. JX0631]WGL60603.1 AAA family ATPase [Pigmentibacter sp. JX0631]
MFIVVTGPDGSGKTTVCNKLQFFLSEKLNERSITIASVWDQYEELFASQEHAQTYLKNLKGSSRSYFIFHAVQRSLELARERKKKIIIMDSYWYKYVVSEIALGSKKEILYQIANLFPIPDLTIYLDISAELALKRKKEISNYEQGIAKGKNSEEKFLNFQNSLRPVWKEIEGQFGPWFSISANQNCEKIIESMFSIYQKKVA